MALEKWRKWRKSGIDPFGRYGQPDGCICCSRFWPGGVEGERLETRFSARATPTPGFILIWVSCLKILKYLCEATQVSIGDFQWWKDLQSWWRLGSDYVSRVVFGFLTRVADQSPKREWTKKYSPKHNIFSEAVQPKILERWTMWVISKCIPFVWM
jgi:hypothetical protein